MPFVSLRPKSKKPLYLELIPKPCWYINVRTQVSKEHWDIIREHVYLEAEYECEICSGRGKKWPVECHERWEWDEAALIQRLVGFMALCPSCHGVKHIGYSRSTLSKTALERLYRHQRRVNKWKKPRQLLHFEQMRARQERRNQLVWTVDITYAHRLLAKLVGTGGLYDGIRDY